MRWSSQNLELSNGQRIDIGITSKRRDGALKIEGFERLDIFDDIDGDGIGTWRGICDDDWDNNDAKVACRQLFNRSEPSSAKTSLLPGNDSAITTFLLDNVDCKGHEDRVIDCENPGRNLHDCGAYEYAGVCCHASCITDDK